MIDILLDSTTDDFTGIADDYVIHVSDYVMCQTVTHTWITYM
jgi:hypothetical protein